MSTKGPDLCWWCKHYEGRKELQSNEIIFCCRAFPEGIPDEIQNGLVIHMIPYRNDNGIQFEKQSDYNKLPDIIHSIAKDQQASDKALEWILNFIEGRKNFLSAKSNTEKTQSGDEE